MPFAGASIGSICYVLSWMIRVLITQYYANFALRNVSITLRHLG